MKLTIEEKQTIETLLLCQIADAENNMPKSGTWREAQEERILYYKNIIKKIKEE